MLYTIVLWQQLINNPSGVLTLAGIQASWWFYAWAPDKLLLFPSGCCQCLPKPCTNQYLAFIHNY